MFDDIADGIKDFAAVSGVKAEKLPSAEEITEIKEEESALHSRVPFPLPDWMVSSLENAMDQRIARELGRIEGTIAILEQPKDHGLTVNDIQRVYQRVQSRLNTELVELQNKYGSVDSRYGKWTSQLLQLGERLDQITATPKITKQY
jgi:hypothetical protein